MKKALLLLPVFFIGISSFAQAGIDDVISAMKTGNASGVTKYFDSYVDITMPDKSSNYSKSQGELIIKDFFSNSGVKSFDVKHKGNKQVIQDIRIQQL